MEHGAGPRRSLHAWRRTTPLPAQAGCVRLLRRREVAVEAALGDVVIVALGIGRALLGIDPVGGTLVGPDHVPCLQALGDEIGVLDMEAEMVEPVGLALGLLAEQREVDVAVGEEDVARCAGAATSFMSNTSQ